MRFSNFCVSLNFRHVSDVNSWFEISQRRRFISRVSITRRVYILHLSIYVDIEKGVLVPPSEKVTYETVGFLKSK